MEPQTTAPKAEKPKTIRDLSGGILSAWIAMEVLSAQSYKNPKDLAGGKAENVLSLDAQELPWASPPASKKNCHNYYQIVLGSIDIGKAISTLLEKYNDEKEERPSSTGSAILATIMVDQHGVPVESAAVTISSFGWGLPVALSSELHKLSAWNAQQSYISGALTKLITKKDKNEDILPLTKACIADAYESLLNLLGLSKQLVRPPAFAIRNYQHDTQSTPPHALLFNSFYVDDLEKICTLIDSDTLPANLQRYLGLIAPQTRRNLIENNDALRQTLMPGLFPKASWPGKGRYPLALLQQVAVNLASNTTNDSGILAVNGPPGTGKTTLLRDVIASVVTERAKAMLAFSDPTEAFTYSGQHITLGNSTIRLHSLDERIRGYEMIVASSNNKAVENISAELPSMEAIDDDIGETLRYFKTTSDALLNKDSWGVIAAVLGNNHNRSSFKKTFWWDEKTGLQRYLQHISGSPQMHSDVVKNEDPPKNQQEALQRWSTARQAFKKQHDAINAELETLQSIYDLLGVIGDARTTLSAIVQELLHSHDTQIDLEIAVSALRDDDPKTLTLCTQQLDRSIQQSQSTKPRILQRLRNWRSYAQWRHDDRVLRKMKKQIAVLDGHMQTYEDQVAIGQIGHVIGDSIFERSHQERQVSSPWLDTKIARLRQDLFVSSMRLHKAFIDAAAKPIRHNMNAFINDFGIENLDVEEKSTLTAHLWSTLFLIVPVVSTTFASVSRMFNNVEPEAFGWLLIDEAGQALPQAALGALMRTKRAVIVGDPTQIEPVVTLPDPLTAMICKTFSIDSALYNAPSASVQTLADRATPYFASFETLSGTREVGVPLLVHRRCADPMFSVSNKIAYENFMVQAKTPKPSAIGDILGDSHWVDIQSQSHDKWSEKEGAAVMTLLCTLKAAGCAPDLYIVTPFLVVQQKMRKHLHESGILTGWVDNPWRWINEHVGTVHTVQGREAEAVIFVLGAPNGQQTGARNWAGYNPNLLNVAITRAQEVLYVVGNKEHWKQAGCFQYLSDALTPNESS